MARPKPHDVTHHTVAATRAAAIRASVARVEMAAWWRGASAELHATVAAEHARVTGALGGIFAAEVFQEDRRDSTIFLPVDNLARAVGRVEMVTIPAAELATVTHVGSYDDVDVAYGDLGAHVAAHEIGVDGPIREYYLRDPNDHLDPSSWITEIRVADFSFALASENMRAVQLRFSVRRVDAHGDGRHAALLVIGNASRWSSSTRTRCEISRRTHLEARHRCSSQWRHHERSAFVHTAESLDLGAERKGWWWRIRQHQPPVCRTHA